MLKTYELMDRHFGWERLPKPASEREILELSARPRAAIAGRREPRFGLLSRRPAQAGHAAADRGAGAPQGAGAGRARGRREAGALGAAGGARRRRRAAPTRPVHILSPFDPLIIQRKRLQLFFDYEHRFEAYVPEGEARVRLLRAAGAGRRRDRRRHRPQDRSRASRSCWCSNGPGSATARARLHKRRIEEALHRFERFQLECNKP